ncbi:conserved hypothetical protein [Pseudarthrobacter chlorophenolicus A6]|uniref:DUF4350 domain-containing protein n=1 Tax=Pseudarthrobacter chlorophenolicus (strain ATCC 700700 / DSM 12829 / CIP 107037 / JCM 12360 / KCTC 9906 / NCIMB 13794 / A6) TaxID=452863 RepID=B8HBM3_PSECP|nr:DUF4350 domain-containing protein [Pseudarthrobacter chlorophenolicus]ACL40411.1 conserved hypothetical protein [Pseudarthrobacter chlorophenolicus A6]SDQ82086.1 protein of unknown function [Pseudarthrobacter chlorophenolicus]
MTGPATEAARDAGTERAAVRSFRSRLRRHRGLAAFGALVAVGLGLVIWGQLAPKGDVVPLSVNNAGPGGARAVAQILGDHGVRVHDVRDYDAAMAALESNSSATLLLYDRNGALDGQRIRDLAAASARVVVVTPRFETLRALDGGVRQAGVVPDGAPALDAACSLPDAQAAGQVSGGSAFVYDGGTTCFRPSGSTAGVLAAGANGRQVVLGSTAVLGNERLDELGNAALGLRLLGGSADLVWYLPSLEDMDLTGSPRTLDELAPDWARFVGPWLVVVALAAIAWRGRRHGPLVFEPLPVVVKAVETAEGRARLYHDYRAMGQARDNLRSGTLSRLATALRLGPGATAEAIIDAAARHLARPASTVSDLVNEHPRSEARLVAWARELHTLEKEVKRR